jgi:hypothetical protein
VSLRPNLPPLPERMRGLPIDLGYPVPAFVWWKDDGTPDFRVIKPRWIEDCVRFELCWLCGGRLGRHRAFVLGPMCAVTRTNSEPPSHLECALFAARGCPFLANPEQRRRDLSDVPDHKEMPGCPIKRNPGAVGVWVTKGVRLFRVDGGVLFRIGEPSEVQWFREGRPATRAEVLASIDSGMPALEAEADKGLEPELERRELAAARVRVQQYLPKEAAA